jgi:hypothetical protein
MVRLADGDRNCVNPGLTGPTWWPTVLGEGDSPRPPTHRGVGTRRRSLAAGNPLPSTTKTVGIDIDSATVTRLLDPGSAQAVGMVANVERVVPIHAETSLDEREYYPRKNYLRR